MSLTDVVSGAGLHVWAEFGLIVSFIAFAALLVWLFVVRRGASYDDRSRLPLDDDTVSPGAAAADRAVHIDQESEER